MSTDPSMGKTAHLRPGPDRPDEAVKTDILPIRQESRGQRRLEGTVHPQVVDVQVPLPEFYVVPVLLVAIVEGALRDLHTRNGQVQAGSECLFRRWPRRLSAGGAVGLRHHADAVRGTDLAGRGRAQPGKVVAALRVADNLNHRPVKHDPGDGDFALQGMNPEIHLDVGGLEEMTGAEGGILGDGELSDPDADAASNLDLDAVEGHLPAGASLGRGNDTVLVGSDDRVDIVEPPS